MVPIRKAKERAKQIENEVLSRNNVTRDFSNKEVYLLLLDEMSKKLDKHIAVTEELQIKYIPEFNKQVALLAEVCKELPEKGFCENMNKMYHDAYPEREESIPDKVKTLWYDRKLLKFVLATSVAALITGIITLGIGFLKGVF